MNGTIVAATWLILLTPPITTTAITAAITAAETTIGMWSAFSKPSQIV